MPKIFLVLFFLVSVPRVEATQDTLRVSMPSEIKTIDPVETWSFYQQLVIHLVYGSLVKINSEGEIVGHFAKSWIVSKNLKTYTFELYKDIPCHDGSKLTANDVSFSLARHYKPENKSRFKGLLEKAFGKKRFLKSNGVLDNFQILSPHKFKIHLDRPYIPIVSMLSMPALSIVKENNPKVGCGPYSADFGKNGEQIALKRFDKYFKNTSTWENIIITKHFTAEETIRSFNERKVDLAIGMHLRNLKTNTEYTISPLNILSYNHLLFNPNKSRSITQEKRKALGQWLQKILWKTENMSTFSKRLDSLLPPGILPSKLKATETAEMKTVLPSQIKNLFKKKIEMVFVDRHFTYDFYSNLHKKIEKYDLPLIIKKIKGPEYAQTLESGDFDLISYPFITGYYDPDGYYINLNNYATNGKKDKVADSLNLKINQVRHIGDKNQRSIEYAKIFRDLEKSFLLIPVYQMSLPIMSRSDLSLPATNFRTTLNLAEVKRDE